MMKKVIMLMVLFATSLSSFALSRTQASREADFLTDKMAYELDLWDSQWSDVYEINYDYFRELDNWRRSYIRELEIRNEKLRYVLTPSQWARYRVLEYFYTPVIVRNNSWHFCIYDRYDRARYFVESRYVIDAYKGAYRRDINHYMQRYSSRRRVTPEPMIRYNNHGEKRAPVAVGSFGSPAQGGKSNRPHNDRKDRVDNNRNGGNSQGSFRQDNPSRPSDGKRPDAPNSNKNRTQSTNSSSNRTQGGGGFHRK